MSYSVTLYCNTGFNAVNIPDRPALLEQCQKVTGIDALEIISDRTLMGVKVRASMELCEDADFCRVGDFYYSVKGVSPMAQDVTYLSLTPDYFTSAGGIDNFASSGSPVFGNKRMVLLDGVTERVHVSDDSFGKYAESDPLCAPAHPLEYECFHYTMEADPEGTFDDNYYSLVESTYDLKTLGDGSQNEGTTYKDPQSGESVIVPNLPINEKGTSFYGLASVMAVAGVQLANTPYSVVREASGNTTPQTEIEYTKEGINRTRALGVESGVSAVTIIPKKAIGPVVNLQTYNIDSITGRNMVLGTGLNYEYAQVKNKKVLYSMDTPIAITTPCGDSREWSVYDLYRPGETAPVLRFVTDPRLDGRPYFGFRHFRGDESIETFFTHCVKGDRWRQRPLVFTQAEGGELNDLRYGNKSLSDALMHEANKNMTIAEGEQRINESYMNYTANTAKSAAESAFGGGVMGKLAGLIMGSASAAAGTVASTLAFTQTVDSIKNSTERQLYAADMDYRTGRYKELFEYGVTKNVVPTEILYPLSADLVKDMCGQGCMVVRYKYCADDIARIDKLLTMYGYKYSKIIEASDFTSRTKFNYIKAGVTVGGLPGWWCDGINTQLSNGVRIWHELPNRAAYSDNPIS